MIKGKDEEAWGRGICSSDFIFIHFYKYKGSVKILIELNLTHHKSF